MTPVFPEPWIISHTCLVWGSTFSEEYGDLGGGPGRPREMINGLEVGVYEERLWDLISCYEKSPSSDLITQGG